MNNQNPIVPPPELVKQWRDEWFEGDRVETSEYTYIANQSAFWSANQELDACCEWLGFYVAVGDARDLRTARRPKPPSLKEQALKALKVLPTPDGQVTIDITDLNTIRRALEALPNG